MAYKDMKQIAVYISDETYQRITEFAEEERRSKTRIASFILEEGLAARIKLRNSKANGGN